jgi:hypothetical protein
MAMKELRAMDRSTLAMAFALFVAGCTSGSDPVPPLPGSGNFDESCPEGDSGVAPGNVLKGYLFEGYVDPSRGIGEARRKEINMCSFYDPTGEAVWGAGSPFEEGSPKPKAIMLNLSAVWCGPCKDEATNVLPPEYAKYGPEGLEVVMVLADTNTPGEAAGWKELNAWVTTFDVQYVAAIDTDRELANEFTGIGSYPVNMLIDPRTLQVVEAIQGVPGHGSGFFQKLEQLLAR